MSAKKSSLGQRLGRYGSLSGLCLCVIFCFLLPSGRVRQTLASEPERIGFPWDWSHEHVVFSNTNDLDVAAIVRKDPRAFHQWLKRNRAFLQQAADRISTSASFDDSVRFGNLNRSDARRDGPSPDPWPLHWRRTEPFERDWGVSLGMTHFNNVNANNAAPLYPAKYTFNIDASPSCTSDYVVFPTGANSKTSNNAMTPNGQAAIVGFTNLYSTQGSAGGFCNHNGPTVAWAYVNAACATMGQTMSSDAIQSSPVISLDGTKVAWVTSTGKVQILTIGSGGGSALAPLCIGSGGDAAASLKSVTLGNMKHNPTSGVSFSQIFVDYNSDSAYVGDDDGFLHKITPFFTATGTLTEVTTAIWQATHNYSVGTLIVDSNGFIEECTSITLTGTSGVAQPHWSTTVGATTADLLVTWTNEGSGGGWPLYVTGTAAHQDNNKLSSPVYDSVSKNIFVGDQNGSLYYVLDPGTSTAVGSCANGATLYPCLGTPGTTSGITAGGGGQMDCVTATPNATCLVMSNNQGFNDPVIVDSSNKLVIMQFSSADSMSAKNAVVEQTNTALSVFHSTTLAGQVNVAYHNGFFDNNYFSNPTSGFFYVCGPDSTGHMTDLYRVGFTNTSGTIALGAVSGTPFQLTTTGQMGNCSPLTEIFNGATNTDWLFLSVDNHGVTSTCANQSCVMSFSLGTSMVSGVNSSYVGSANLNGTGGIIIDNVVNTTTFPQASSIYFMPVASNLTCGDGTSNTGCGIKLTQAGLQ
jgi:hypothetical protein